MTTGEHGSLIAQSALHALEGGPPLLVMTVVDDGFDLPVAVGAKLCIVEGRGEQIGSTGNQILDQVLLDLGPTLLDRIRPDQAETVYIESSGTAEWLVHTRRSKSGPKIGKVMVQVFKASPRLLIVGAGHVALALARVADIAHFDVVVTDDRSSFANEERFPMASQIVVEEPALAIPKLMNQADTYIVLVSRGHRLDEEGLRCALTTNAKYVGMIGSQRRTQTVLRHMAEEGYDRDALGSVSTPIGLDLGGESPEEIAISIVAEILMLRNGASGKRLRGALKVG